MATYDDPRILRAIAHPTRNRILAELFAVGTQRAADIARALDIPANQASFHLRQLAKYGLVEEAPGEAQDKRDRVWRLADEEGVSFRSQDIRRRPGGEAALTVFERNAVAWHHFLVEQAHARREEPAPQRSISDYSLRLTDEEVLELTDELGGVVQRWRDRTRGNDPARTTYSILQLIQPYPDSSAEETVKEGFRVRGFGAETTRP